MADIRWTKSRRFPSCWNGRLRISGREAFYIQETNHGPDGESRFKLREERQREGWRHFSKGWYEFPKSFLTLDEAKAAAEDL